MTKTITNICNELIDRIFDLLDFESLMNVANTCKRLQIAAAAKFSQIHAKKCIWLSGLEFDESGNPFPGIDYEDYSMNIDGLKFCFPFLRCFGAKIPDLNVLYSEMTDLQSNRLDYYINQYCADTLKKITLDDKQTFSVDSFSKPFKSVTNLDLTDVNLGNHFPNFVNWFPNLNDMNMSNLHTSDETTIAVHFPHLEHLRINFYPDSKNDPTHFTFEDATDFLRANKQLKSFEIQTYGGLRLGYFLDMISENTSIIKLHIFDIIDVSEIEFNRLVSEHPLLENLCLRSSTCTADMVIILTRQLKSLKQLSITVMNHSECDRFINQLDNKWKQWVSPHRNPFVQLTLKN